jgi:hypothetical protein
MQLKVTWLKVVRTWFYIGHKKERYCIQNEPTKYCIFKVGYTRKNKQACRKDIIIYFIMICLVFDCEE